MDCRRRIYRSVCPGVWNWSQRCCKQLWHQRWSWCPYNIPGLHSCDHFRNRWSCSYRIQGNLFFKKEISTQKIQKCFGNFIFLFLCSHLSLLFFIDKNTSVFLVFTSNDYQLFIILRMCIFFAFCNFLCYGHSKVNIYCDIYL